MTNGPDRNTFKICLHVPNERGHRPVSLLSKRFTGVWLGALDAVAVTVARAGDVLTLRLARGAEVVAVAERPFEVTFHVPAAWIERDPREVFVTL